MKPLLGMRPGRFALFALLACLLLQVACRSSSAKPMPHELALEGTQLMTDLLGSIVTDPQRSERARAVLVAYQSDELGYIERIRGPRLALFELNAEYDTPRSSFDREMEHINVARSEFLQRTTEMLSELKQHVRSDEWDALFEGMKDMDAKWEDLQ